MRRLAVVLANYNQAHLLRQSVERIERAFENAGLEWNFVLVDDGSTDDTWAVSQELAKTRPTMQLVKQPRNRGRGRAVADGIRAAEAELAATLDTDLEVAPEYLLPMAALFADPSVDVVLAHRHYPAPLSPKRTWELGRWLAHRGYRMVIRGVLGTPLDTASGCRIFRRSRILPVLDETREERWFWDTEVLVRALRAGLRIVELPVACPGKPREKSTFSVVPEAIAHVKHVAKLRRELAKG